jgi:hypothetical protein
VLEPLFNDGSGDREPILGRVFWRGAGRAIINSAGSTCLNVDCYFLEKDALAFSIAA